MNLKWCQSKHVHLIKKCYPPKTANPPKPNSSELSYLTYYAYTTPSKLKKVGKYLEHRVEVGLAKGRTGDVTVTLDICTALIKKCFRDLYLFASNIVAILDAVVRDGELVLVEHSVSTLKAFCSYHDGKYLAISQQYRTAFQKLCQRYAQYGIGQDDPRAQYVSLDAVANFISSEAFQTSAAGGQIKIIVPALVQTLSSSSLPLSTLESRMAQEGLTPRERRQSFFSREVTATQSGTPRSSMQVEYTDEENCLFALKNLKQICEMNNASLIRVSLNCLMEKLASLEATAGMSDYATWAVDLVTLITGWLPIQHRYLMALASLESLERSRLKQDNSIQTPKQELILTIVEGVLTTGESLIGLNVIDVLNILIEQLAIQITVHPEMESVLQKLANSIIGLAGHIYYTDQIRDMCSTILEWSGPLFHALEIRSGKETPGTDGDDEILSIKRATIWSLRVLKGILAKRGGSIHVEEIWIGTEGGLTGKDGEIRMEYVDALMTHLGSEWDEEDDEHERDSPSSGRFLTMIQIPIFKVITRGDASASDYWAIWVLLLSLLRKFEAKEVIKALPMLWRALEILTERLAAERQACVEGIFLGFLNIVSTMFNIPDLQNTLSKEIEKRKSVDYWPAFVNPHANPTNASLHDILPTLLTLPSPSETTLPFPPDLQRPSLINALAFSKSFPETLREHLLVPWTEETTMPEEPSEKPASQYDEKRTNPGHSASNPGDSQSGFPESQWSEEFDSRKKTYSQVDPTLSPAAHIDELRKVLADESSVGNDNIPKIEINGEKAESTSAESQISSEENETPDILTILDSLTANGHVGDFNEKMVRLYD